MVETLLDKSASWLSATGPESDVVVQSQCLLYRNLADYPFPGQCSDDEKKSVEERVVSALDSLNLMATGQYWSFAELSECEQRFLSERFLVGHGLIDAEGARGVYIDENQSLSICINDENHLTFCGLASGLQLQEIWNRISLIDDTLAGVLDYAYSDRLGYLTTAVKHVGTGLNARITLHLPALVTSNLITGARESVRENHHTLKPFYVNQLGADFSDLYRLSNDSTLGRAEEETLFHLKHIATELIEQERVARKQMLTEAPLQAEDRVGRALGLARGARLLAFDEAVSVLSSLRLGVSSQMLDQFSLPQINDVFIASQSAQIEMKCGHECDELTISSERAELFRARFI